MNGTTKRAVRVGGASGGFTDRQRSIHDIAKTCDVDVIMGDWMSECTMTIHGATKQSNKAKKLSDRSAETGPGIFDPCFLGTLEPALPVLQEKKVKLAVNAGASDAELLAREVRKKVDGLGLSLKVAWIEGDDVYDQVKDLRAKGDTFVNTDTGKPIEEIGSDVLAAQCYLGAFGIAKAFEAGADIVICGRVADAAPAVAAAAWWHGWSRTDFDSLAGALVAGHLIECSAYITGGYYAGFKTLMDGCENLGFPIASIESDGTVVLTKEANTGGEISFGTVTTQMVYEIQGPLYYNSDVTADISGIRVEEIGKDEVKVTGIKGLPPPPTTRVGITAKGPFQAEFHYLFSGLDIEEKAEWTKRQILKSMGENAKKFDIIKFHLVGSCPEDPDDQDRATVDFRIFVQTRDPSALGMGSMASLSGASFTRWCMENFLQSAPGAAVLPDMRQSAARSVFEYWPSIIPQSVINHRAMLEWSNEAIDIPAPSTTQSYPKEQRSWEPTSPVDLASLGPTTRGPLGWVVMGRSGDKASNANVGLFVRHDDEYDWLRTLLSTPTFVKLLGKTYTGKPIDRCEFPGMRAVHFLLHDHLDRGFNSASIMDGLGKNLCEYLRARHVDIPNKFLERGRV